MTPEQFRKILTHEDSSVSAFLWRGLLETIRPFYSLGVRWRNHRYDSWEKRNSTRIFHAPVPVLSIGNLTLGGTGKSPAVRWFVRELQALGLKPAVLSRGYRAKEQKFQGNVNFPNDFGPLNDEGREMARLLPGVPLLQNPDRSASAQKAVELYGARVLVLDDGFQHRKLFRDLNIVLIDAEEPFGLTGRLFPAGTLREPMSSLRRADGIILTHATRLSVRQRHTLREELNQRFPASHSRIWVETEHRPVGITNAAGELISLPETGRFGAFCGIGKPNGFFKSLSEFGITPLVSRIFPDHHPYTSEDVHQLAVWGESNRLEALLCTEKDLMKLPPKLPNGTPIYALRIELRFLEGEEELRELIKQKTGKF